MTRILMLIAFIVSLFLFQPDVFQQEEKSPMQNQQQIMQDSTRPGWMMQMHAMKGMMDGMMPDMKPTDMMPENNGKMQRMCMGMMKKNQQ